MYLHREEEIDRDGAMDLQIYSRGCEREHKRSAEKARGKIKLDITKGSGYSHDGCRPPRNLPKTCLENV